VQDTRSRVPLRNVLTSLALAGVAAGCGDTPNPVRPSALSGVYNSESLVTQPRSVSTAWYARSTRVRSVSRVALVRAIQVPPDL
jgi:hypothetical protein